MLSILKAVLSSVLILGLIALRKYLYNPLRKIPGPICTNFTKIWLLRRIYSKRLHLLEAEAHETYGKFQFLVPQLIIHKYMTFITYMAFKLQVQSTELHQTMSWSMTRSTSMKYTNGIARTGSLPLTLK
jgi:hypothetical protein